MKLKYLLFLFLLFTVVTCIKKPKQQVVALSNQTKQEFFSPTITVINELHDTLKPVKIFLKNKPKPISKIASKPTITNLPLSSSVKDSTQFLIYPESQGKGQFTSYTSDDGLAIDGISFGQRTVFVDKQGNIWFATKGGGISKYDGKTFINYTVNHGLINNSVRCIYQDNNDNFWFGTDGGISKYDGKSFTNITTNEGLVSNVVMSITQDQKGDLWFGTQKSGVSRYNGKSFKNYTIQQGLANNSIRSIVEDKNGDLWFGTNEGLSRFDGKSFKNYTTKQGLTNNSVLSIIQDEDKNLWFGTLGGGISMYNGEKFVNYTTKDGLIDNTIFSIFQDKKGDLWFGSEKGISKYDHNSFVNFTTTQGLVDNTVFSITQDNNGNLWFGTYGGVSKYEDKSFVTFTTDQGLANNSVFGIIQAQNGDVWFGTYNGLSKYDGKSFKSYTTEQGLENNRIYSILQDNKENIWFGTDKGVTMFDGKYFITYSMNQGLEGNSIFSITQDDKDNLWFGTYGRGVSMFDGKSFVNYTTNQGLANNYVLSIFKDKSGNLWFGTYGGGVSMFNGESFVNYSTDQGLANNYVLSIAQDDDENLWFGTYGGGVSVLTKKEIEKVNSSINKGEIQTVQFLTLTSKNGLPDNGVAAVQFNNKGEFIVGSNFGLWVLSSKEVEEIIKAAENHKKGETLGIIGKVYNQFNGYPIKDVNTGQNNGAMLIDDKGLIWVGHGKYGVTRVDLDAIIINNKPPQVVIQKVSIKGEDVCFYSLKSDADSTTLAQQEIITYGKILSKAERDTLQQRFSGVSFDEITKFYPLPNNLVLSYNFNAITFEFNAIETGRNFAVNYQFRLRGLDENWSPITKKNNATYTNLHQGNYTFLLKAQSPNGVWSEPVEYQFVVLPPWYKTWWAYFSYIILTVLFIWSLIRIQTKKLKQRQKELENEVAIATAEIKNTLEVVEQQKEQVEEAHKEITDSINYAERIQRSFLATDEILNKNLTEYFVFFQPKDVVSGDFYWAAKLNNGTFAMVNADSTGHGVPGAIMSILNISSIELAIERGNLMPAAIFNSTRKTIIERLKKDGSEHGGKDGMDASIICYNFTTLKMTYCAAQNPIWIIRKGEVIQIKPEKMPVGKHDKDHVPFVGGEFQLQKGDQVYTFTDGFQDQFGGPKGKKFMIKKMRQLVLENSHLPMAEQHQKIAQVFNQWKQDLEQVDDVCVIGIVV